MPDKKASTTILKRSAKYSFKIIRIVEVEVEFSVLVKNLTKIFKFDAAKSGF